MTVCGSTPVQFSLPFIGAQAFAGTALEVPKPQAFTPALDHAADPTVT